MTRHNNDNNDDLILCQRRYGTSFTAQRWLSLQLGGVLGVSVSWSLHLYSILVSALYLVVSPSSSTVATAWYVLIYIPTACLALVSLHQATFTNPGAVEWGARPLTTVRPAAQGTLTTTTSTSSHTRTLRRCHKCHDNYKPPRAHHDSQTGRCIVKLDHYCPWVNNAIGVLNHKFFVLFLFYTALCCIQVLVLLGLRFWSVSSTVVLCEEMTTQGCPDETTTTVWHTTTTRSHPLVLILAGISFLFLVFTCAMGYEQYEAIQTGHNKIARMQMRVGQRGTELHRVTHEYNEVFGCRNKWWWSPFHAVEFPRGMRPVVLGYEWDPAWEHGQVYVTPDEEKEEDLATRQAVPTAPADHQEDEEDDSQDVEMQAIWNSQPPPPSTTTRSSSPSSSSPQSTGSYSARNRRKWKGARSGSLEIV